MSSLVNLPSLANMFLIRGELQYISSGSRLLVSVRKQAGTGLIPRKAAKTGLTKIFPGKQWITKTTGKDRR